MISAKTGEANRARNPMNSFHDYNSSRMCPTNCLPGERMKTLVAHPGSSIRPLLITLVITEAHLLHAFGSSMHAIGR
jgi:hypothetical protein